MKKFAKLFIGVFCALLLTTAAFAADTTVVPSKTPVVTVQKASPSFYNAGEFGLSLGSGYSVDRSALFKQPYTFNLNGGLFYFPWRNIGFELNTPFFQTKGVSFDEIQAGLLFRLPLAKQTPILKSISPYVGVSGVYDWQASQDAAYIAKAGTEFRFNNKVGFFVEGQYRNRDLNIANGQTSVNGGLKVVLF